MSSRLAYVSTWKSNVYIIVAKSLVSFGYPFVYKLFALLFFNSSFLALYLSKDSLR